MQLTQVYSQKSTSTTLPRSCLSVSGGEFSQVTPEGNSGARTDGPGAKKAARPARVSWALFLGAAVAKDNDEAMPKRQRAGPRARRDQGRRLAVRSLLIIMAA